MSQKSACAESARCISDCRWAGQILGGRRDRLAGSQSPLVDRIVVALHRSNPEPHPETSSTSCHEHGICHVGSGHRFGEKVRRDEPCAGPPMRFRLPKGPGPWSETDSRRARGPSSLPLSAAVRPQREGGRSVIAPRASIRKKLKGYTPVLPPPHPADTHVHT